MFFRLFKINGQIVYSYEYQETPLSDEKDEADVKAFIEGFIHDRVADDEDLGKYKYEVVGHKCYTVEKV